MDMFSKFGCSIYLRDWGLCKGIINQMEVPFYDIFKEKLMDKDYVCGIVLNTCPTDYQYEDFDSWKSKVLSNKPTPVEKKPTLKSSYTILQINDLH